MKKNKKYQRIVIGMLDGLGLPGYEKSKIPFLKRIAHDGYFAQVKGVFPSVTNVNNVSICTGAWPNQHGISANSYFDKVSGTAIYMNSYNLIRIKTVFERAAEWGIQSALLTSKKKTAELFKNGTTINIAAESVSTEVKKKYGTPPDIYSREINYWIWNAALDILKNQPEIGLLYVHTTDYPMHKWAWDQKESLEHLAKLDELIEQANKIAPAAAIFLTADHGMNYKKRCYDLKKVCEEAKLPLRFVLSPERDYYIVHHRNFTGCAWIWLENKDNAQEIKDLIKGLKGVEDVLESSIGAHKFQTDTERLGDLVVLGDQDTMFGEMENKMELLPDDYRAHGSLYEMDLPLIIYNYQYPIPPKDFFRNNFDLTRFLFRA